MTGPEPHTRREEPNPAKHPGDNVSNSLMTGSRNSLTTTRNSANNSPTPAVNSAPNGPLRQRRCPQREMPDESAHDGPQPKRTYVPQCGGNPVFDVEGNPCYGIEESAVMVLPGCLPTGSRFTSVRRADAQRLKMRWPFPLPIFARSLWL